MWKCDPAFADVNHDGYLDLAGIPRLGDGPKVWLGNGAGQWTEASDGLKTADKSCGGGLRFGDVNNDGHLDLAVADHCAGLFVYLGDGEGHWTAVTQELNPPDVVTDDIDVQQHVGAEDVDLGDVNGDGFLDLVAASTDRGGINVYLGDGTGVNWKRQKHGLPTSDWANRVQLVDIDGDDSLDIVASYAQGPRVWRNDGAGNWQERFVGLPTPMILGLYTGLAVADINEDGRPDLATANWVDGPEVYLQQADGSWLKTPDVFPDLRGGAIGLDLGDLDGDGHIDMVVAGRLNPDAGYVRGVFALRGDGKGNWEFLRECGLPVTGLASTVGVTLGDINGDGLLDVAAGSGLIVETVPDQREPVIPQRILVWCACLDEPQAASSASSTTGTSEMAGEAIRDNSVTQGR